MLPNGPLYVDDVQQCGVRHIPNKINLLFLIMTFQKPIRFILVLLIVFGAFSLQSCGQDKVNDREIEYDNRVDIYTYHGKPFTGIGVNNRGYVKGKSGPVYLEFNYYEDGEYQKKERGISEDGDWDMDVLLSTDTNTSGSESSSSEKTEESISSERDDWESQINTESDAPAEEGHEEAPDEEGYEEGYEEAPAEEGHEEGHEEATSEEGSEEASPEEATAYQQNMDPQMIGVWRRTESYSDPVSGFSYVIQETLALHGNGTVEFSSKSAGGNGGVTGVTPGQELKGYWKTENKFLFTSDFPTGPWMNNGNYLVDAYTMMLKQSGGNKLWNRIQ